MSSLDEIKEKLKQYKRKFYQRQVLVGAIGFFILAAVIFLLLSYLEYKLWLSSSARTFLFFSFVAALIGSLYLLIVQPLLRLFELRNGKEDEEAAQEVVKFFPEIEDRLLNVLQLGKQSKNESELINAAIDKKAYEFKSLSFVQAVDFKVARKYLGILGTVIGCFFLVSFVNPDIIKESPKRIVQYSTEFEREAPFDFILLNESLEGFKGEDFVIQLKIEGEYIPDEVKILLDDRSEIRLVKENWIYSYTFERIQSNKSIQFEASGFNSKPYNVLVHDRPSLLAMNIIVQNPNYTGGERRVITNTGDLSILEGSIIKWEINASSTQKATIKLGTESSEFSQLSQDQFVLEKRIYKSGNYQVTLQNPYSLNTSDLIYNIDVIEDLFPQIQVEFFPDSSTYQFITMAGSIIDDYGFTEMALHYRRGNEQNFQKVALEIDRNNPNQSFYANWNIDTLNLKPGSRLEMHLSVADNDGVNGAKVSKSQSFVFQIPTEQEIDNLLDSKSEGVENQIDRAKEEAESISEKLSEVEDRLKSEQKFDWQEKKMLEDVLEDREELNKQIEELQKKHEELRKSNEQFRPQSKQLKNKSQKMQELLDELMDEETRKLYEKLKELMKENASQDEITQQIEELRKSENNLERDLERALELFKRLKMESVLEQNLQKLDSLGTQQEQVAEQNDGTQTSEEAKENQEKIQEQFDEFREKMDEVLELNQDLKRPEPLEDFEYEERQIAKELREIMEEMENNSEESEQRPSDQENENQEQGQNSQKQQGQNQKTQQKQKNAAQKMKNLSQKLSSMQGGMQMEMMQANLDQLRDILDNLIKLSFNQEDIMNEMREVNQSDPRFLELSQQQLKLKDDAKVIEDSLLSLASKVVQISSFVTREVGKINDNIDETIDYLRDRNRGRALSSQQFAMTSINNLALLLDDTMQQMQMTMSDAMGNQSDQKQQSKGLPDLQELQNQLGEQMNELKGSGKSGRELSEELARLAAEQEMIRRRLEMLKELEDGKPGGGQAGDDLQRAIDMMEQNEVDLVNKRLTQQLINRQKLIQTRLLEAEKAQREQETEEEREADRPSIITREVPPEFEEYLKLKKKEIELLKTIPIELNPFYKKEVNDYFRRISTEDKE